MPSEPNEMFGGKQRLLTVFLLFEITMNKRFLLQLAAIFSAMALLTSCGKNASPSSDATMRVINFGVDYGAVNVAFDDVSGSTTTTTGFASNVARESASGYANVHSGTRSFTVSSVSGGGSLLVQSLSPAVAGKYTMITYGVSSSPRAMILQEDTFTQPAAGFFRFRVAVPAIGLDALDLYLTAPGVDLSTTSPSFAALGNGVSSATADFAVGTYQLRATVAGTKTVVFDGGTMAFVSLDRITLAIYTIGSNKLANAAVLKVDDPGTFTLVRNTLGRYRFFQGNPGYSLVNVLFNGVVGLSNVPFTGASGYVGSTTAARTLTISPSATPGTNVISQSLSLTPAQDSTIMLAGSLGNSVAVVLPDTTLPSAIGKARVRFVNGSIGGGQFDVFVNFQSTISGLTERSASSYFDFDANIYAFAVNSAGTGTQVLNLPNITLEANKVYSIFLVGPTNALQGVVIQDN